MPLGKQKQNIVFTVYENQYSGDLFIHINYFAGCYYVSFTNLLLFYWPLRVVHWVLYGFMKSTIAIFALLPLLWFVGPLAPYNRTIMSNSVPTAQQAQIFSAFSALEGIASLLGPLYSAAYTLLVQEGCSWLIFEIMAGAAAVALMITVYIRSDERLSRHLPEDVHGHGGHHDDDIVADAKDDLLEILEEPEKHPDSPEHRARLLDTDLRVVSRDGLVRRSVDQRATSRGCSMDESTLLFRHLSNSSATTGMVQHQHYRASRSTDGFGSSVTARLLADSSRSDVQYDA